MKIKEILGSRTSVVPRSLPTGGATGGALSGRAEARLPSPGGSLAGDALEGPWPGEESLGATKEVLGSL